MVRTAAGTELLHDPVEDAIERASGLAVIIRVSRIQPMAVLRRD